MTKTHIKRLEKLATHLESGELGHDKFDFSVVHKKSQCGTAGCAMGEMPVLWPQTFTMRNTGIFETLPFFGITHDESYHLFVPECQEPENYGGRKQTSRLKHTSVYQGEAETDERIRYAT